jgi:predicted enzyme related to lactoylglutathione lyase
MPDAFEQLRVPTDPVEPDPAFRERLRALVARAIDLPEGVAVSTVDLTEPTAATVRQGDLAYASLWVPDVARAATFFATVLDWEYAEGSAPQGRQVLGRDPHHGLWETDEGPTLFLTFSVDDVDEALERVRAAGGTAGEPDDAPYGRVAECVDPMGMTFAVHQLTPGAPRVPLNGARHGDLAYVTMEVIDTAATSAFYGAVLGWEIEPGRVDDGWGPIDVAPMAGFHGGHDRIVVVPMYRVDDIESALVRVRDAGGTAPPVERQPYGLSALCEDDQGTRFYLWQE